MPELITPTLLSHHAVSALLAVVTTPYAERALEFVSLKYHFATVAMLASVIIGAMCGLVGTILVLRGMSLLGDAAGHATLPGLAIAFLITGSLAQGGLLLGALLSALAAALLIGALASAPRSRQDASIGVTLSVMFGLGTVLLSYIQRTATTSYAGLDAMLLGNAAGITDADLARLAVFAGLILAAFLASYRWLALSTFDPVFARAIGLPTRAIHYGLIAALAICVVLSIQAVGVVLVSAMLIIPACAARFVARSLPVTLLLSALLGAASGFLGAMCSYMREGLATGPAMVLVAATFFVLAALFGPRGGVLRRWAQRRARRPRGPLTSEAHTG